MKSLIKGSLTTLALAAVALSIAQTNGPQGFSLRAGAAFPQAGSTNLALGVDFKLPQFGAPAARGVYASYFGISGDWYGNGDRWNIPIAATYNVRNNNLVFSGGVGIDWEHNNGDTNTGLGFQVGATYEFQNTMSKTGTGAPIFLQAKYFFARDSDLSGFGLYLGVRF